MGSHHLLSEQQRKHNFRRMAHGRSQTGDRHIRHQGYAADCAFALECRKMESCSPYLLCQSGNQTITSFKQRLKGSQNRLKDRTAGKRIIR